MQDFEVDGEYIHAGRFGEFVGVFRLYDDRVVGTVNDSSADIIFNKGKTKLVIGNSFLGDWRYVRTIFR